MKKEWINPTINMLGASETKSDDVELLGWYCHKCDKHHGHGKPCDKDENKGDNDNNIPSGS